MKKQQRDRISREIEGMFRQLGADSKSDREAELLAHQHRQNRAQATLFLNPQEQRYLQA